jgi:hypothetical protein
MAKSAPVAPDSNASHPTRLLRPSGNPAPAVNGELLLAQLVELLAAALAPQVAELLLAARDPSPTDGLPSRRLLMIDELVALLPAGKNPQTWKNWIYQKTRFGQLPGCYRLGGRLFFNPDETLPFLLTQGKAATNAAGLDVCGDHRLHAKPMSDEPTQPCGRDGSP